MPALTVESGRLGPAGITQYADRQGSAAVECARSDRHWIYWAPHPTTDRLVCMLCHPPAKARTK